MEQPSIQWKMDKHLALACKIQEQMEIRYAISMIWPQTQVNGQQRPLRTLTTLALVGEASTTIATTTPAIVATALLPSASAAFPLGPHFM